MERDPVGRIASSDAEGEVGFRELWFLSLAVSITTVVVFFAAANILNGRNGLPLGGDPNTAYTPWMKQALVVGAASLFLCYMICPVQSPVEAIFRGTFEVSPA